MKMIHYIRNFHLGFAQNYQEIALKQVIRNNSPYEINEIFMKQFNPFGPSCLV